MKLYLAAKQPMERDVLTVVEVLERRGHSFTYKWWELAWEPVKPEAHWELSDTMLAAIEEADALVLVPPDAGGVGCFIELGYAIGLQKDVYVLRHTSMYGGRSVLGRARARESSFFHNEDRLQRVSGEQLLECLRA